jgi:hypothetical protein
MQIPGFEKNVTELVLSKKLWTTDVNIRFYEDRIRISKFSR